MPRSPVPESQTGCHAFAFAVLEIKLETEGEGTWKLPGNKNEVSGSKRHSDEELEGKHPHLKRITCTRQYAATEMLVCETSAPSSPAPPRDALPAAQNPRGWRHFGSKHNKRHTFHASSLLKEPPEQTTQFFRE